MGNKLFTYIEVEPRERATVLWLFSTFAALVFALLMARTVRDALFLNAGLAEALAPMYVGVAFAVVAATKLSGWIPLHSNPAKATRDYFWFFSITYAALFLLLSIGESTRGPLGDATIYGLYFWVEIMTALLMVRFWLLPNRWFNTRQAKRLYSLITSGQILGNIACGAVAGFMTPYTGTDVLLLIVAMALFVCGWMFSKAEKAATQLDHLEKKRDSIHKSLRKQPKEIQRYCLTLVALTSITFIVASIVDYQFKLAASTLYSSDELTRFFGTFYGLIGTLSFFVQVCLAQYLVRTLGLFGTLILMPIGFVLGGIYRATSPSLMTQMFMKGNEHLLRYSINDPLSQMLSIPLPISSKARLQSTLGGIVKPVAIGLAGLLMIGFEFLGESDVLFRTIAATVAILSLAWIFILVLVRKQYVGILAHAADRFNSYDDQKVKLLTAENQRFLQEVLLTRSERSVAVALQLSDKEPDNIPLPYMATAKRTVLSPETRSMALWQLLLFDREASRESLFIEDILKSKSPLMNHIVQLTGVITGVHKDWNRILSIPGTMPIVRTLHAIHQFDRVPTMALSRAVDIGVDVLADEDTSDEQFALLASLIPTDELHHLGWQKLAGLQQDKIVQNDTLSELQQRDRIYRDNIFLIRLLRAARTDEIELLRSLIERVLTVGNAALIRAAVRVVFRHNDIDWVLQLVDGKLALFGACVVDEQIAHETVETVWNEKISSIDNVLLHELWSRKLCVAPERISNYGGLSGDYAKDLLNEANAFFSVDGKESDLHRRTRMQAGLIRLALALRIVGSENFVPEIVSNSHITPLARQGAFATVAELCDQLLTGSLREAVIHTLEIASSEEDLVGWQDCPWQVNEHICCDAGKRLSHPEANEPEETGEMYMDLVERIVELAQVDLFCNLPLQSLGKIAEITEEISYDKDSVIIVEGDQGDSLFLLVDGQVEVRKGSNTIVALYKGTCFGEMSLLDDQPRSADVVAIKESTCLRIWRDDFEILLDDEPTISKAIMRVLTSRLRIANIRNDGMS